MRTTCNGQTRARQLRALACLLILLLAGLTPPALAWAPERFYDSVEELPGSAREQLAHLLPQGEVFLTAHKNDAYILLLTQTAQDGRRLTILEEWAMGYAPIFQGVLPDMAGDKAGIASGLDTVHLRYGEAGYYVFRRYGSRWLLRHILGRDDMTLGPLGLAIQTDPQPGAPPRAYGRYVGERDLEWVTAADLPLSYEEAAHALVREGMAVVSNPDPADRLHLRVGPDRGADSLGKFYNGTLVEVLERQGAWYRVRVSGLEGWMMRRYLTEGDGMDSVPPAFPQLSLREEHVDAPRFTRPDPGSDSIPAEDWGIEVGQIIGLIGEEWYILLNGAGQLCYMRQAWFWAGNG